MGRGRTQPLIPPQPPGKIPPPNFYSLIASAPKVNFPTY